MRYKAIMKFDRSLYYLGHGVLTEQGIGRPR